MTHLPIQITAILLLVPVGWTGAQEPDQETLEFVETKVRPLLEARCFECHASNSKEVKGGLLLDSTAAIRKGGESGPAVVPGKPGESLLIEAINYDGYEMPPRSKLPAGEIEILTKWVRLGAPLPGTSKAMAGKPRPFPLQQRMAEHWSWHPIKDHSPPTVRDKGWPTDDIDRFILSRLERKGLKPAAPADRRTLVRRIYFDLIGLPPTPEQVAKFAGNPKPDQEAVGELIDELLASPHFGERWARHWMDLVRYAETLGHEFDYPLRHAHEYRDYLIRAFNADVPYDQFATEHIAGDLMPNARRHPTEDFNESIIGTGFWFFGEAKHAPVDAKGEEAAMVDNQIDVFSKTFLGLTVSCARCHDHKFDAISAADYYALSGFLQSSRKDVGLLDPGQRIASGRKKMETLIAAGSKVVNEAIAEQVRNPDAAKVRAFFERTPDPELRKVEHPLYVLAATAGVTSANELAKIDEVKQAVSAAVDRHTQSRERFETFADFSDGAPADWFYTGEAIKESVTNGTEWKWQKTDKISRHRPGRLNSARVSGKLQGVLRSPTFTLNHNQIVYRTSGQDVQVRVIIEGYWMNEFNGLLFNGAKLDVKTGGADRWVRQGGDVSRYKGARCHIEVIDWSGGGFALQEIAFTNGGPDPTPVVPKSSVEILKSNPRSFDELFEKTAQFARAGVNGRNRAAAGLLNSMIDAGLVDISGARAALDPVREQLSSLEKGMPNPRRVLAIADGSAENERLFVRGSHKNLGDVVPRRSLEAFRADDMQREPGSGRLLLAKQLFDGSNPYPARVMANRIWHHLFGSGIVASPDNFGVLGKRPTHPELLDHLAKSFESDGWSIKRLIKRLMLTRTYQMASVGDDGADTADPENLLRHRAAVRRLQGEPIRDALLAISGRLDRRMYGGSVPVHLTHFMQGRGRPKNGPLDGNGRRSVYIKINRNFLSPLMLAFDTPIPFTTIGRRGNSNVPAQALILLNDPFVTQQAELWAKRTMKEASDTQARVERLYESAFARSPTADELKQAADFVSSQGDKLAAWKDLCHVLINTKEFIFLN